VAFLSETPAPDLPEFLRTIAGATYSAGGRSLTASAEGEVYRLDAGVEPAVEGFCDLGVMDRQGTAMRLIYTGRLQRGVRPADAKELPDHLRVALVERPGSAPAARVWFRGEPAAGAEVKAILESGEIRVLKADAAGWVEAPGLAEGTTGLLAKWIDSTPGLLGDREFKDTRYYATLAVAPGSTAVPGRATELAELVEPVTSFGGAVLGDHMYVYSGHVGKSHRYHTGTTSAAFRRMDLRKPGVWEELPAGPPLQGVTLVAHEGAIYRVGGMEVRNPEGEPDDLASVAGFARFDPETRAWTDLPPLPEPRSTHDSVVVGNRLYVIGGWLMPGGEASGATWHEDALVLDLDRPEEGWRTLPTPPFQRRALAVASDGARIYAIGGLEEGGKVSREVDVFDPVTGIWAKGPEFPGGGKTQGFGPSAFGVGGRVYACGADGVLRRLEASGEAWEEVGQFGRGRLMSRLLPGPGGTLLLVGGSVKMAATASIEWLEPVGR
jgi:hypothetical protein